MRFTTSTLGFTLGGHLTPIALADEFWDALRDIAEQQGVALTILVERIAAFRGGYDLESALVIFATSYFRRAVKAAEAKQGTPRPVH